MKKETLKWVIAPFGVFLLILLIIKLKFDSRVARYINACEKAFGKMDEQQRESIENIIREFDKYGDKDLNKLAYILGTARHESRLRSIEERRASSSQVEVYQNQNRYWLDGYYGRGLVQLTWERNYIKMTKLLNVDFVSKPHLALVPSYSARILVQGMMEGSFTRKKLDTYINEQEQDFYKARKTVNGTDRADRIKGYTLSVLENL